MFKNTRPREIARGSSTKDKQWWWATPQDGWKPFKRDWMQGDVVEVWTFTKGNPEKEFNNNDYFYYVKDPLQNIRSTKKLYTSSKKRVFDEKKKKKLNIKQNFLNGLRE